MYAWVCCSCCCCSYFGFLISLLCLGWASLLLERACVCVRLFVCERERVAKTLDWLRVARQQLIYMMLTHNAIKFTHLLWTIYDLIEYGYLWVCVCTSASVYATPDSLASRHFSLCQYEQRGTHTARYTNGTACTHNYGLSPTLCIYVYVYIYELIAYWTVGITIYKSTHL